jgi:protein TonB
MFEDTLLDSSPSRTPVLNGVHYAISLGLGLAAFLAAKTLLPALTMAEEGTVSFGAGVLGGTIFAYALMVCYVFADSRQVGLSTGLWVTVTLLLNLVGYLFYAYFSAKRSGNWTKLTILVATILEVIVVGIMVLVPLIYTEALPRAQLMTLLVAPPPPPPPPPPPAAAPVRVIRRVTADDIMRAPTVIPKTIAVIKDEPEPPQAAAVGVVGGVPGGMPGGTPGGVLGSILSSAAAAPPPPPPPQATTPKRIRVGGQVEQAKLIFKPTPEYPALAKVARIQGVVRLEAIISRDGTVQDLKVLSGHPLLVKSALEAVQRWRYQPTLLNGEPVEIVTEIDVNFSLAN